MFKKEFLIFVAVLLSAIIMSTADDAVSNEENAVEEMPRKTTKRGIYSSYGLRGLGYGYYGGLGDYGYYGGLGGYYPYPGYYGYSRYHGSYPYYGYGYGGYGGYGGYYF